MNSQDTLLQSFKAFIERNQLLTTEKHLLVAVSGGVDSVVLCDLLHQSGYRFGIAHCNFGLRGADSDADEDFVKSLALKHEAAFFCKRFDTASASAKAKTGIQETARTLRYEWFSHLLQHDYPDAQLVTAHHADDNIETVLMNFFKGTGLQGLTGMNPVADAVQLRPARPLLFAQKSALVQYAVENNLTWHEDSSNSSTDYTRNYIRLNIIPLLEKQFPSFGENMLANIQRFHSINQFYQSALEEKFKKWVITKGDEIHIPVMKIKQHPVLLYELTRNAGFSAAQQGELLKLLRAESGKFVDSASHRVLRNRNWLIIAAKQDTNASIFLFEAGVDKIALGAFELTLQHHVAAQPIDASPSVAQVDAAMLEFPLLIRPWKQGDYFYPLGMRKKKKLSRFLIDQKMSLRDKAKVFVVESNKRIVWVIGKRIDDRFKVTDAAKPTVTLTLRSAE